MDFSLYGDDSKGLIKLDPRTKLFVFLCSMLMSINTYSNMMIMIYAFAICALLALCGEPWMALKSACLYMFMVYLRLVVGMSGTGAPVVVLVISALTVIFLFFYPVFLSAVLLIKTTRISQFLSAFQAMHLPMQVIIPVAVLFRFLPTVQEEWTGIRKAMAFRGISLTPAFVLRHPGKTIEYILIPLLFSSVSVMEELAAAALARGMDIDAERTSYEEVRLHGVDYFVLFVFAGLFIMILISGALAKGGRV